MLRAGDEPVPGYRLDYILGRGGFGEVWRAMGPGRTAAALKFVNLSGKPGLKEFRAIQRVKEIRHANLLPIYAVWMLDDHGHLLDDSLLEKLELMARGIEVSSTNAGSRPTTLVVAMVLADGNLLDLLRDGQDATPPHAHAASRGVPLPSLLSYMEDSARAIDFLNSPRHDLGSGLVSIQHCDIKPQNIVRVGDSAMVCDFGLAQVLEDSHRSSGIAGTPAYMAPECIAGHGASPTTDQYSLAITYYHLRTGMLPFDNASYMDVLGAHLNGRLDFSRLAESESAVLRRATAIQPADRYPLAQDLVRALRAATGDLRSDAAAQPLRNDLLAPTTTHRSPQMTPAGSQASDEPQPSPHSVTLPTPHRIIGENTAKQLLAPHELWIECKPRGTSGLAFHVRHERGGQTKIAVESSLSTRTQWNLEKQLDQLLTRPTPISYDTLVQFGRSAFRLLLPDALQDSVAAHEGTLYIEGDDALPWEFFHNGSEFLAARQPLLRTWSAANKDVATQVTLQRALVISNPAGDLPSASDEGSEAAALLRQRGIGCDHIDGPEQCSFLALMDQLDTGHHQLIYVSARALWTAADDAYGIALADQQWLAGDDLARTLRGHPLVVLNLVHSSEDASRGAAKQGIGAAKALMQQLVSGNRHGAAAAVLATAWWGGQEVVRRATSVVLEQLLSGTTLAQSLLAFRQRLPGETGDARSWTSIVAAGNAKLVVAAPAVPHDVGDVAAHGKASDTDACETGDEPSAGTDDTFEYGVPLSSEIRLVLIGAIATQKATRWTFLSTLHLWLGLTYLPHGKFCRLLEQQGIDPTHMRRALREAVTRGDASGDEATEPISDNVKAAFRNAAQLAIAENSAKVREPHLLAALDELPDAGTFKRLLRILHQDVELVIPRLPAGGDAEASVAVDHAVPADVGNAVQPEKPAAAEAADVIAMDGSLRLDLFEAPAVDDLQRAQAIAFNCGDAEIHPAHCFAGMLHRAGSAATHLLTGTGVEVSLLVNELTPPTRRRGRTSVTPQLHRDYLARETLGVLRAAAVHAAQRGSRRISDSDLCAAIIRRDQRVRDVMSGLGVAIDGVELQ